MLLHGWKMGIDRQHAHGPLIANDRQKVYVPKKLGRSFNGRSSKIIKNKHEKPKKKNNIVIDLDR